MYTQLPLLDFLVTPYQFLFREVKTLPTSLSLMLLNSLPALSIIAINSFSVEYQQQVVH